MKSSSKTCTRSATSVHSILNLRLMEIRQPINGKFYSTITSLLSTEYFNSVILDSSPSARPLQWPPLITSHCKVQLNLVKARTEGGEENVEIETIFTGVVPRRVFLTQLLLGSPISLVDTWRLAEGWMLSASGSHLIRLLFKSRVNWNIDLVLLLTCSIVF